MKRVIQSVINLLFPSKETRDTERRMIQGIITKNKEVKKTARKIKEDLLDSESGWMRRNNEPSDSNT